MATPATPVETQYLDFGRAFQFFFEDPEWVKKILIGGLFHLLAILLVGLPFVFGYTLRVTQRTARGEAYPLPEWDDYGGIFMDGLRVFGFYLVHIVAALVLPACLGCVAALLAGLGSKSDALGVVAGLAMVAAQLLWFVILLAVLLYFPAAYMRLAVTGSFSAGLEWRENIALIRRGPGNYFLAIAMYLVSNFVAQFGALACCIGLFPAAFWGMSVAGWAFGEVARRDQVLGGQTGYAQVFA